jgi:Arc/MetJ-type ribon-helix-helix transcriptional regulator
MKKKGAHRIEFTSISVPTKLFRKVEKHVENTGFPSVSSYVAFILRTLLSEKTNKKADYETEIIKERLKELGYM